MENFFYFGAGVSMMACALYILGLIKNSNIIAEAKATKSIEKALTPALACGAGMETSAKAMTKGKAQSNQSNQSKTIWQGQAHFPRLEDMF
jgi:hypothetical protein